MDKQIQQYLDDYRDGKIQKGLDTGCIELDEIIRYKQGQLNIINGIDNVGKTAFMMWYFLCLSNRHNLTWCIWTGENKAGQIVRQLIEFYSGEKVSTMRKDKIYHYMQIISQWFRFVDNSDIYKSDALLKIFSDSKASGCLIDPYTGLNRGYSHADNYDFLNEARQFCNSTNMTMYVNTHPNTAGANMMYGDRHEFAGYPMPPSKSQSEGGQPFASRTDDFLTIHRLTNHPTYWRNTMIYARKIKDTETGGRVSFKDQPVNLDYNNGLGFICNGVNPLTNKISIEKDSKIPFNNDFAEENDLF
jgi:hypothetical protein